MNGWRAVLVAVLAAVAGTSHAQADVGLVNLVVGEVTFVPQVGQPGKAKNFMRVREGDRFELAAGAQLRLVYFDGSRQERWLGPASFRAARAEGTGLRGQPAEVQKLPGSVPQRMARVPELLQNARLGGVQVRGAATSRKASEESLGEARTTYQSLRRQLPSDDITAELFLFSALNDNQLYDEMAPLIEEMQRKQPENEDVRALAAWLKTRRGR